MLHNLHGSIKELANKLAREEGIPPTPKPRMVSDIGYIMNVDTKNDFWKGEKKIIWDVKIPSTGKLFVCEWDAGFSRFKKDDSVKLIHDANSEGAERTFRGDHSVSPLDSLRSARRSIDLKRLW